MSQSIQVIVRARPPVSSATIEDANNLVVDEEKARVLLLRKKSRQHAEFQFSKVFGSASTQEDVYAAVDIVKCVCEGVSGCVLAYGQTNTGIPHPPSRWMHCRGAKVDGPSTLILSGYTVLTPG